MSLSYYLCIVRILFNGAFQCYEPLTREHAVGNPSAIEGQTANILTSRTGL